MAALLMKARQRYILPQVHGFGIELESQQHIIPPSPLSVPLSPASPLSFPSPPSPVLWRHRFENLLWIASAFFIVYFGDFRTNFFSLVASDSRIHRTLFDIALACLAMDLGIYLYLLTRLHFVSTSEERLEHIAPGAVPAATLLGLAAFILLSAALWPIWNVLTLPMLFTLFMALVVVAPYLPPYVSVTVDSDSIGCLVRK